MRLRKNMVSLILAGLFFLFAMPVWADQSVSKTVQNKVSTGDVRISLKEYSLDAQGLLCDYANDRMVLPSEVISKIPVITNEAMPAYIRCQVVIDSDGALLPEENLLGIGKDWQRIGDYYYLTRALKSGEQCSFFEQVRIPSEWDSKEEGTNFQIALTAQAIQAANFHPDFTSQDPWQGTAVQECIHESGNQLLGDQILYQNLIVEIDGNSKELILVPDDFFENLELLMPGDERTDQIQIRNTSSCTAELFFSSFLPEGLKEEELALLKACRLILRLGNDILYDGPLSGEALQKELSLGKYEKGSSGHLSFTICMPAECENSFALRNAAVIWKFRAKWEDSSVSSPITPASGTPSKHFGDLSVRTGLEEGKMLGYFLLMTMSFAALLWYCWSKRPKRRQED